MDKYLRDLAAGLGVQLNKGRMIKILNVKSDPLPEGWVYIGRAVAGFEESPLHNPWRLHQNTDRDEVLAKYKRHLWEAMRRAKSPERLELFRLVRLAKQGDLYLGCWCAPESCHGDLVKKAIEWIIEKDIHEYDDIK